MQARAAPQSELKLQTTQVCVVGLQRGVGAAHSVSEAQVGGRGTHALARHTSVAAQSTLATQSTQRLRAVSQT